MKSDKVKALFLLAGFTVTSTKPLVDGYSYHPDDSRFTETLPRCAWWFVRTEFGWVEFGRRKKVFSINWEDTKYRGRVTADDVTCDEALVHAWSEEKALEYLKELHRCLRKELAWVQSNQTSKSPTTAHSA